MLEAETVETCAGEARWRYGERAQRRGVCLTAITYTGQLTQWAALLAGATGRKGKIEFESTVQGSICAYESS